MLERCHAAFRPLEPHLSHDIHTEIKEGICHIMTDFSLSNTTHTAPFLDPVLGTSVSTHSTTPTLPNGASAEDEEDYTIKCVCEFEDDDGSTVLCDKCDTWQHIDCYYPGGKVFGKEEVHNCSDCDPRPLDGRAATARQRSRRNMNGLVTSDRKTKKPTPKSHKKKKAPESNSHTNGWAHDHTSPRNGNGSSPKDQPPPAKRTKTNHRTTNSMHAPNGLLNHTSHSSKRSVSASHALQSPTKSGNNHASKEYHVEPFTLEFLHLYDDDPGDTPMQANLFNDIAITDSLSSWSHDVEAVVQATNGRTHQDIFLRCDQPVDSMTAVLHKHTKTDPKVEYHGIHPRWTYLTVDSFTLQGSIVGELRGKIGHMKDYVEDPANRWEYLRHPLPFVFFHPYLPIYIDTRREGSTCRYLRRSCRPNLTMKTFLENGSDYHFCFVANCDLEADTELTIAWTLDEHVRAYYQQLNGGVKLEGSADTDESYVIDYVGKVLADFGECACNGQGECTMARYDRRNNAFGAEPATNGKSRKRKSHHKSSHSTTRATTSRSGSEALKHQEDDDQDGSRSTSASCKSKPNSRDLTPSNGISAGLEISDRDKRKIAAVEKSTQQLAQDNKQSAPKKRSRNSGGSTTNTPTTTTFVNRFSSGESQRQSSTSQPATPGLAATRPRYVDTGTSRRQSGSPITKSPLAPIPNARSVSHPHTHSVVPLPPRSTYVDSSMQTDPDPDEIAYVPPKAPISFTRQILMRCHQERVKIDEERNTQLRASASASQSPTVQEKNNTILSQPVVESKDDDGDIQMQGTDSSAMLPSTDSNLIEKHRPPDEISDPVADSSSPVPGSPKPQPLSQVAMTPQPSQKSPTNGHGTDLHIQLPPTPTLPLGGPPTPAAAQTPSIPSIAQPPILQTPSSYPHLFTSSIVQPSPIKKKLSLGDYMSRRGSQNLSAKAETPTSTTVPTAPSSALSRGGSSPTIPPGAFKSPLPSLSEEDKVMETEDSTVAETVGEFPEPMTGVVKDGVDEEGPKVTVQ